MIQDDDIDYFVKPVSDNLTKWINVHDMLRATELKLILENFNKNLNHWLFLDKTIILY